VKLTIRTRWGVALQTCRECGRSGFGVEFHFDGLVRFV